MTDHASFGGAASAVFVSRAPTTLTIREMRVNAAVCALTGAASGIGLGCARTLRASGQHVNGHGDRVYPRPLRRSDLRAFRVNPVSPGHVQNLITASWSETIKTTAIALTPIGRLTQPNEIASVASFVSFNDARFVTREVIEVNGEFYLD